jgi:hypothetical protein
MTAGIDDFCKLDGNSLCMYVRILMGRLVIWIAEFIDRSLIAVPEIDD